MDVSDDDAGLFETPEPVAPSLSPGRERRPAGLTAALRRARIENAERGDVVADLRGGELTRLEILRDHLAPVFDEIPVDCDMFDPGIAPGEKPRLFIDMVAFVEMGRDRRSYRLIQDTRAGRRVLSESERVDTTVRAVTDYIARRLVERERALATLESTVSVAASAPGHQAAVQPASPRARPTAARIAFRAFLFFVEVIGSAVVFGALAAAALFAWQSWGAPNWPK